MIMFEVEQVKIDIKLLEKYGAEKAALLGMIADEEYLWTQGKKSGFSQTMFSAYPWDIRNIEGKKWYGFSDTDLKVLVPSREPEYTRQLLDDLVDDGALGVQLGSTGKYYSFLV